MKISSSVFKEGEKIPQIYTCQGKDINPPLSIKDVPKETISLVLIVDDPDVPIYLRKDGLYVHWVVFNIDPTLREIPENAPNFGITGKNTGNLTVYKGPCPPDREHRYFFKLYALDTALNLAHGATKEEVEKSMQGHILAEATLMGLYEKT